jgi:hypothetical protein
MGVTNIRENSTVPTARFTLMFLFKKQRIMQIIKKENYSIAQVGENEKSVHKTTNFSIQTR